MLDLSERVDGKRKFVMCCLASCLVRCDFAISAVRLAGCWIVPKCIKTLGGLKGSKLHQNCVAHNMDKNKYIHVIYATGSLCIHIDIYIISGVYYFATCTYLYLYLLLYLHTCIVFRENLWSGHSNSTSNRAKMSPESHNWRQTYQIASGTKSVSFGRNVSVKWKQQCCSNALKIRLVYFGDVIVMLPCFTIASWPLKSVSMRLVRHEPQALLMGFAYKVATYRNMWRNV